MTDYDKIKADVEAKLDEFRIAYNVRYLCETVRDGNWKCDHFRVSFNSYETDYYTGLGHRKPRKGAGKNPYNPRIIAHEEWEKQSLIVVKPRAADVLRSLLMDAEAMDTSFHDWCDECGYDTDSLKARNTYDACCEIGIEMRSIFTHAQRKELQELVQDL